MKRNSLVKCRVFLKYMVSIHSVNNISIHISMNKYIIQFITIAFILLAIFKNSFSGKRFTCKNFLLNAYLYIFLSLVTIFLLTNVYADNRVRYLKGVKFSFLHFMIFLFLSLLLLYGVLTWSPKDLIGKHAIWFVWLALMAYILYPMLLQNALLFQRVKLMTITVMTILTLVTFWKPHLVSLSWGSTLLILLVGLILIRLFGILLPQIYTSQVDYIVSYVSLVLFSFFMLWDTKFLMVKAKQCVNADYINDSLGVVLDGLNIFTNLFSIHSSR